MPVERMVRVRVRETRGGTPNIQDVARRGEGGVLFPVGNGRWAMMSVADAALTEEARAAIVNARQARPTIEEIKMPVDVPATPEVPRPEMLDDPQLPYRVVRDLIKGASLLDGRARAEALGGKFRLPTEQELLEIFRALDNQIPGINNYWIWTKTETRAGSGVFVLRHSSFGYRDSFLPENRFVFSAVLLVEDR